ncbi:anhydro-N-acetylmuramic acid kinase [Phyllobacterium sp. SYP-B3895]|uniref:anhydro-N-acetylmuramic acid kinase n=1 Tax=Phyllobacterium sp. SYP-B3895 TaxID=2663240 RepID=UPI0012999493|nr:anhydro-N-acetylmuramic acid kinase [Phyllobacterium sp. SYP-B3895]MRG57368.1 anhydro-N-acetylmuramic acid kinase [Phyllobacterium sp. SYP-B3895]
MAAIRRAIGLMSGTSMDGIDIALVETDGGGDVVRGPSGFTPYETAFRRRIETSLREAKAIQRRNERPGTLAQIEEELTRRHGDAVKQFLSDYKIDLKDVDIIGFHGQTVLHRPGEGLTVQLGDGELLAKVTGIPVVYDMRANDMVHGGQGAPLVPAYHSALTRHVPAELSHGRPVVFVNIGGISNVTIVPSKGDPIAFDTGPGNTLIDQWVEDRAGIAYDAGGAIASEGEIVGAAVTRYLTKPFFDLQPPKSLDRNDFTLEELGDAELADGARTLARVTADAILKAGAYAPETPSLWIICGGGRKNATILKDLSDGAGLSGAKVVVAEDFGFNGDSMEAEAWAYLAVRALYGLPLTWPTTTGCKAPVSGGVIAGRR